MLDIEFTFPDWAGKLEAKKDELNRFQAAIIQENRGQLFDNEGSYNGHAGWAPLSLRSGQILSNRGNLRRSLSGNSRGTPGPGGVVRFDQDVIAIGTTLAYAKMMNYGTTQLPGGVLRPKNAKALKIPIPAGQNANNNARNLRATKVRKQIAKAQEALTRAQARAGKKRAKFEGSGDPDAMNKAVTAEKTMLNRRQTLERLQNRANKIMDTGKGGQNFIFRKSVKIPPRDFISWNAQDQQELAAALLNKIAKVLNG